MQSRRFHRVEGFTLVELVVVIVVLGLLAAFAVPRFLALNDKAEQSVVQSYIGTLRSARVLAYSDFLTHNALPGGYTGPQDFTLTNLVRCDGGAAEPRDPNTPGGHYADVASLRENLFSDPAATVCNGNSIQFVTKSGRTVTISGAGPITWSVVPAY